MTNFARLPHFCGGGIIYEFSHLGDTRPSITFIMTCYLIMRTTNRCKFICWPGRSPYQGLGDIVLKSRSKFQRGRSYSTARRGALAIALDIFLMLWTKFPGREQLLHCSQRSFGHCWTSIECREYSLLSKFSSVRSQISVFCLCPFLDICNLSCWDQAFNLEKIQIPPKNNTSHAVNSHLKQYSKNYN